MKMKFYSVPLIVLALHFGSCQKDTTINSENRESTKGLNSKISEAPDKGKLVDGATYRIRGIASVNGGPVMEVTGNSSTEGAQIQQWNWFPNNGQKWTLQKVESNYYKLINVTSNKALHSASSTSGVVLTQSTSSSSTAQQWAIAYNSANNAFTLTNRANGLKVAVDPNNNNPGTKIKQLSTLVGNQGLFDFHNLTFKNPIISDKSAPNGSPDPFVATKDGFHYLLYTKGNKITMRKTRAMSLVAQSPEINVYTPPTGTYHSKQLWAPEMFFLSGKWYIYFAASNGNDDNHRMFVLENPNADPTTGTFTFKGKIYDSSNQWAIDGTVLTIGSTNYFVWSGWENTATKFKQHIYIASMSNPWTITGARKKIVTPTISWEKWEPEGQGLGVCEAPIAFRRDSNSPIFLAYSGSRYSSDNYCLGYVQLTNGANPKLASSWTNKTRAFIKNPAKNIYGPGHNGFFRSSYVDGNGTTKTDTWFVYHSRSVANNPSANRKTRMQKITWSSGGTPSFGTAVGSNDELPVPIGE